MRQLVGPCHLRVALDHRLDPEALEKAVTLRPLQHERSQEDDGVYMVLVQRVRFRMAVIGMALIVLTQISTVARRPEIIDSTRRRWRKP
jgi:hypothetical protein